MAWEPPRNADAALIVHHQQSCLRKRRYRDGQHATKVRFARWYPDKVELWQYQCVYCEGYHITSKNLHPSYDHPTWRGLPDLELPRLRRGAGDAVVLEFQRLLRTEGALVVFRGPKRSLKKGTRKPAQGTIVWGNYLYTAVAPNKVGVVLSMARKFPYGHPVGQWVRGICEGRDFLCEKYRPPPVLEDDPDELALVPSMR